MRPTTDVARTAHPRGVKLRPARTAKPNSLIHKAASPTINAAPAKQTVYPKPETILSKTYNES